MAATDADNDRRKMAALIEDIAKKTGWAFSLDEPAIEGNDWNDQRKPIFQVMKSKLGLFSNL